MPPWPGPVPERHILTHPSPLSPEAAAAAERGDLIIAIKLVREQSGLGLKESKDAVDHYLSGDRSPRAPASSHDTTGFPVAGYAVPAAAVAALQRGNKMEAVKLMREAHKGLGLAQAKELVEACAGQPGVAPDNDFASSLPPASPASDPMAEPGRVSARSSWPSLLWLAAILLAAFGLWTVFGRR